MQVTSVADVSSGIDVLSMNWCGLPCEFQINPILSRHPLVPCVQAVFTVPYMTAYLISPRACHAFVCHLSGLTGEAISDALADLDAGTVPAWQRAAAPASAAAYWGLPVGYPFYIFLGVFSESSSASVLISTSST